VRISKEQQIAHRRQMVKELRAQGLTQQEIANRLPTVVDQKTVSNDLAWIAKESIEIIRRNREQITLEYDLALSNFHQLRKKAWLQFARAEEKKNEDIQLSLYPVIESINANIMALLSTGDIINKELADHAKQQARQLEEEQLKHSNDKISRHTN
jgi:hypothetical protein